METIKNIIIGFGKGGKTLAKFLAQKGEEVLVIEKSNKMYGGTCTNIACLPSKRLIIELAKSLDIDFPKDKTCKDCFHYDYGDRKMSVYPNQHSC